jgi:mannosyl-oligosaccharide alpha-1,2-mannosidase
VSGLGPDEMVMDPWPGSAHAGRWIEHVEAWEKAGREGGIPPGLHEVPREVDGQHDYHPIKHGYLLRPEVRFTSLVSSLSPFERSA